MVFKAEGMSAGRLREGLVHTRQKLGTSERRTCPVVGLARSTLQNRSSERDDDELHLAVIRLRPKHPNHIWSPASAGAGFATSSTTG